MPFTVSTVTTPEANGVMRARKMFYANGLFWIFYSNGTNGVWRTSSDGETWSSESIWRGGTPTGVAFSIHYDGAFIHYVWAAGTTPLYRRGLLNSDGSITWSAVEQNTDGGIAGWYPTITVDSSGQPWIGFSGEVAGVKYPYVSMSTATDGTWTTGAGFPYQLSAAITGDHTFSIPVALSGGNVYAVYGTHSTTVRGQLYDVTTGWGAEEVASTSNTQISNCNAVADSNDNIHVIFEKLSAAVTYTVTVVSRESGVWGAETALSSTRTYIILSKIAVDTDTNALYAFWADSGSIYMQIRDANGSWSGVITVLSGEGTWKYSGGLMSIFDCSYQKYERSIMLTWMNGTASPYSLRFDTLSLLESSVKTAPNFGL